jgi:hypothetical protein
VADDEQMLSDDDRPDFSEFTAKNDAAIVKDLAYVAQEQGERETAAALAQLAGKWDVTDQHEHTHDNRHLTGKLTPKTGRRKDVVEYEYTEEVINVALAAAVAQLPVCRQLMYNDFTWSDVLEIYVRKATNVRDGLGRVTSAWWETFAPCELKSRRYSGIFGTRPTDVPEAERRAPPGFCCLSPFALPRPLKYILRTGTGACDIDLYFCHVQMQLRRLSLEAGPTVTEVHPETGEETQKKRVTDCVKPLSRRRSTPTVMTT